MVLSGNPGAVAYRERHPDYNTPMDEDIVWALKNYYVAYNTETDIFTTTEVGEFRLMECEGEA